LANDSSTPPRAILTGRNGQYTMQHIQGRGAFGATYRGRRVADQLPVVVKVLRLDRISDWNPYDLFERESEVLRALAHPGIPTWLDHFPLGKPEAPEGFALVQTFIEGRTLAETMRIPGALSQQQMLAWFDDLLAVLDYLHRRSPPVIHRDVTPKNIILRPDGRAALVDFGSVQAAVQREGTVATTSVGTFGYAAPEQFLGRATPASDLHGAGMTFLAVTSGHEPPQMPIDGARVNVRALLRGEARLAALLEAMTETDPRLRLADAAEARKRLARIRQPPPTTAVAAPPDPAPPPAVVVAEPSPAAPERPPARPPIAAGAFLSGLRARLARADFRIEEGGQIARTAIELHAWRPARRLDRLPAIHLHATTAENLEGNAGGGPLTAAPLVLLAKTAGAAHAADQSFLGGIFGPPATVLTVVTTTRGMAPHAAARVEAALRTDRAPVLAAAVVTLEDQNVVLMVPPVAWGRSHDKVLAHLVQVLVGAHG
jgi:serine/threonine protein kinase